MKYKPIVCFYILSVTILTILPCCQRLEGRLDDVSSRIDEIENNNIAALEKQLAAIGESLDKLGQTDAELKSYIDALQKTEDELQTSISENDTKIVDVEKAINQAVSDAKDADNALVNLVEEAKADIFEQFAFVKSALESRLEEIESTISELQSKDAEIEKKISDLKAYTDSKIDSTKDWASETFTTLEQYNSIVSDISGIRDSIEKLEASMTSLENRLSVEVNPAVDKAVSQIDDQVVSGTAAAVLSGYTETVSSVRNEMESLVSRVVTLESDVKMIKEEVDNIKNEIANIYVTMGEGLQSLVFASPAGRAIVSYKLGGEDNAIIPGETVLQFEVSPAKMADTLAAEWESSLELKAVYTMTKAVAGESIELPIKSASAADGILTITASGENIDDAFFKREVTASVRLLARYNGVCLLSKYVPLVPHSDAGAASVINIPDVYFKKYLVEKYDIDGDDEISEEEALAVKVIDVSSARCIYSLAGLEHFANLEILNCSGNNLTDTELDLTGITQLKILDVTDNPNLTRVICPSATWLYGVLADNDITLSYVDTSGRTLYWGTIRIGGSIWSGYNSGSDTDNLYGNTYTFDHAQKACPDGWRTPTKDELEYLSKNYSSETTVNGMKGRWFSGSRTYSSSVPAVFLPYKEGASCGEYWSSTEYDNDRYFNYAYALHYYYSGVNVYHSSFSRTFSVRCVKN